MFEALRGVEQACRRGGLHADEVGVDGQAIGLVLVLVDAEVVGLDEFDEVFPFGDAAREEHLARR